MSSRTGMPFLPVHIATSSWQHSPRWVWHCKSGHYWRCWYSLWRGCWDGQADSIVSTSTVTIRLYLRLASLCHYQMPFRSSR
jgi:hypothetical protein